MLNWRYHSRKKAVKRENRGWAKGAERRGTRLEHSPLFSPGEKRRASETGKASGTRFSEGGQEGVMVFPFGLFEMGLLYETGFLFVVYI